MKRSGRRTSDVVVDMTKFGLDPVPTDKIGRHREALAMERPKAGTIAWQREAGSFDVGWGLPDFGVFCRTDTGRAKDPWRRGIDVVDDSSTGQGLETSPLLAIIYLNWLEACLTQIVFRLGGKLLSPSCIKSPAWEDVISGGAPSRPCSAPLALGGSWAGGAISVALDDERLALPAPAHVEFRSRQWARPFI